MTFETLLPWLLVTGGILCLGLGGSWLVDGASRIALKLGISPMVVGLTVVGFGTSMPEFAVSVMAALRGSGGLSLGNAVGSNIMNLLLVLGVAAALVPIHVVGSRRLLYRDLAFGLVPAAVPINVIRWDIPILVAATVVVGLFVLRDGRINRGEAAFMLALFAAYLVFLGIRIA
jgi:cation:H+ antiporter